MITGDNRTMVAAATILWFPLVMICIQENNIWNVVLALV